MIPTIDVRSLSLAFNTSPSDPVVASFSMTLGPGLVGLAAPNGAGKSTLMAYLQGQPGILVTSGDVTGLEGVRARYVGQGAVAAASLAGWLGPLDNAALPYTLRGMRLREARRLAADASGELLRLIPADRISERLSGGEKQVVVIARELARQPAPGATDLLIMDEPATGLDFERRVRVMEFVTRRVGELGMLGLVSEHSLELLAMCCTRVIVGTRRPLRVREVIDIHPQGPRGMESLGSRWLNDATQQIQASLRKAMLD